MGLIDLCESMQVNQKNCVDETCIFGIKIILTKWKNTDLVPVTR